MPIQLPLRRVKLLAFGGMLLGVGLAPPGVAQQTRVFTNTQPIVVADALPASPYPSPITVAGMPGVISRIVVTVSNLHHRFPDDLDLLLIGPEGQRALLMSDAGGSAPVTNLVLTFDTLAAAGVPDQGPLASGVFKPTNFDPGGENDVFYAPATPGPYSTSLAVFNGLLPSGEWQLFVVDDAGSDDGGIDGGWQLEVTTVAWESVADLALRVTDLRDPLPADAKLVYELAVTNQGPNESRGILLRSELSPGVNYLFATPTQGSCGLTNGAVVCSLGSLPAQGTATITLGAILTVDGVVSNRAVVTSATADFNPENSAAVETTTIYPAPTIDLAVSGFDQPDPAILGQNLTYTLMVTNEGPLDATGVVLRDTLDATVTFQSAGAQAGSCTLERNEVICVLGDLPRGATAGVTVTVMPNLVGTITNVATVTANEFDLSAANSRLGLGTVVYLPTDLSVHQVDSRDPTSIGSNLTYTVYVQNNGPGPATGVILSNRLPTAVNLVSASWPGGSCEVVNGEVVRCDLGNLAPLSFLEVAITVQPTLLGAYYNTATVTANETDSNPANNIFQEQTTVFPGGNGIVITPSTNAVELANAITSGGGTGVRVRNARLQAHHALPDDVFYQPEAYSSGLYSVVNPPFTYGLEGLGVIMSSGNVLDYSQGPNRSSGLTTYYGVFGGAPATTNQEALLDPITASGGRTFTHYDVTQLDVEFDLVPGFENVLFNVVFGSEEYPEFVNSSFIDGFGIYLNGVNIAYTKGRPVNINHPDMRSVTGTELDGVLAPDGNPILTFSQFLGSGATNNRLTFIISDTSDGALDTTVFVSSLQGTIPPNADLALSLSGPTNHVIVGSNVTYRITVTNQGPNVASSTVVSNVLPASMQLVAPPVPSQGSCGVVDHTVICDLFNLSYGYAATITLIVAPTNAGLVTNWAIVGSAQHDFGPTNNAAAVETLVLPYGSFVNTAPIAINDGAPASPYPALLPVTGLAGVIGDVTLTLKDLSHRFPADLDVLLVSPDGRAVLVMSDAGGNVPIEDVTLEFTDQASVNLPAANALFNGRFRPTDFAPADAFFPPAPAGPYATTLSRFRGQNPNGLWRLYVLDDMGNDSGVIQGGWTLQFDLEPAPLPTDPSLTVRRVGSEVGLSWPAAAGGYVLEMKAQLSATATWATITNLPVRVGDDFTVSLPLAGDTGFFRLRKASP